MYVARRFQGRDQRGCLGVAKTVSGDVLRRLQARRGFNLAAGHAIVNDVLIALSARSIGGTVVTQNADHYRAIQTVSQFQLVVID